MLMILHSKKHPLYRNPLSQYLFFKFFPCAPIRMGG